MHQSTAMVNVHTMQVNRIRNHLLSSFRKNVQNDKIAVRLRRIKYKIIENNNNFRDQSAMSDHNNAIVSHSLNEYAKSMTLFGFSYFSFATNHCICFVFFFSCISFVFDCYSEFSKKKKWWKYYVINCWPFSVQIRMGSSGAAAAVAIAFCVLL